jgi:DNA modification methylase
MDGAAPELMVTDPPYGVNYEGGAVNENKREKMVSDDTTEVFSSALNVAAGIMKSGAWYIWHAGRVAEPVYQAIRENGFEVRALIIWNKLKAHYGAPSAHYCQKHEPCLYAVKDNAGFIGASNEVTVWDIDQPHINEFHPTQKPVECMERAIRNHKNGNVYDPFLGSGSTLIAAQKTGRRCYGLEIDPIYCDVIVKRWEAYTGKTATLSGYNGTIEQLRQEREHATSRA